VTRETRELERLIGQIERRRRKKERKGERERRMKERRGER
jgi:hypothetical protein